MTKECYRCKRTKPIDEFYRHKYMADGYLGQCKECCKSETKKGRAKRLQHFLEHDRERRKDPRRRAALVGWNGDYRRRHPERAAAHKAVGRAKKSGRLVPAPCVVCGDAKTEAHHHDYSLPLDVIWFCATHHKTHGHGKKRKDS